MGAVQAMVTKTTVSQKSTPERYLSQTSDQTSHFKRNFNAVPNLQISNLSNEPNLSYSLLKPGARAAWAG